MGRSSNFVAHDLSGAGAALRDLFMAAIVAAIGSASAWAGQSVTDSAGRTVEVPDRIERVVVAGPPATGRIISITAAPNGTGYFLVNSTGEIFGYGSARSTTPLVTNGEPIVAASASR